MLCSLWDDVYKSSLAATQKEKWQQQVSSSLSDPLPNVRCHITIHVLSASVNKVVPSLCSN